MAKAKQFSRLSRRAKSLLKSGETRHVDYKENLKGPHAEDLVAFANSEHGGAVLVGVEEFTSTAGTQEGRPIGCPVDDDARLQVLSKALSCSPAVEIELFIENLSATPFLRIEIPSGSHKPYATSSGTYKIREDSRNNPLLPEALLKLFLEREGAEFRTRFSEATGTLETRMQEALAAVNILEGAIAEKIEDIGNSLGWAEYKAGDAADTIDTVQSQVMALANEQKKQAKRIKAIILKTGAKDPIKDEAEKEVLEYLVMKLSDDPELLKAAKAGASLSITLNGSALAEIDEADLRKLFVRRCGGFRRERVMMPNNRAEHAHIVR
jgi:predicted HTH transcriptional regulator